MSAVRFLTLKVILPLVYRLGSLRRLKEKKAIFVEVSAEGLTDSFELLYERLKTDHDCSIRFLHNGFTDHFSYLRNCISMLFFAADAKLIFINEASNVLSCFKMRKGQHLIQTWHGCGAFKRFGFSTADLGWGVPEEEMRKYPYYRNQSLVPVSGPECVRAYMDAMRQDETVIRPLGVSRTDVFFDAVNIESAERRFFELWPEAAGKKIILFAPTFRGTQSNAVSVNLDYGRFREVLKDRYVIAVKHHPFVKRVDPISPELSDLVRDVTGELSIEELLMCADICVTDYSSLIFEYSLMLRPMVFFAPDLPEYYDERGFYYPYEELVPGPICLTEDELLTVLSGIEMNFNREKMSDFRDRFMGACDGHSTERILEAAFSL